MVTIRRLHAMEILDSRDNPTIEVSCELESGALGKASVPSGASKGTHEALELRDGDMARYGGLGVLQAIDNVCIEINNCVADKSWDQRTLDKALRNLDGTENKSRLGANAILGVSLAFARACAEDSGIELYRYIGTLVDNTDFTLPQPMFNIINGGKHADSGLDIQECMVVPIAFDSVHKKIEVASEIIHALKEILEEAGYTTTIGDEGGFAPKLTSNEEAFGYIEKAINKAGYSVDQVRIAIDAAASTFYDHNMYTLKVAGSNTEKTSTQMIEWYQELRAKHPIISIEDGLAEDDWEGWKEMNEALGGEIMIVGDDLTVTNVARIQDAIGRNAINSVLIKPNQIGTLSETIDAIALTKAQGWKPFISHRSGETLDTFIADLAVGLACPYIKAGSLMRGERVAKYNRLMEIEDVLRNKV
jgi:enolase